MKQLSRGRADQNAKLAGVSSTPAGSRVVDSVPARGSRSTSPPRGKRLCNFSVYENPHLPPRASKGYNVSPSLSRVTAQGVCATPFSCWLASRPCAQTVPRNQALLPISGTPTPTPLNFLTSCCSYCRLRTNLQQPWCWRKW